MQSSLRTITTIKERIAHAISPLFGSVAASIADVAMGIAVRLGVDVMVKPNHAIAVGAIKEEVAKAKKNDDGESDSGTNDDDAWAGEVNEFDRERYGEFIPPRAKIKSYAPGSGGWVEVPLTPQQILDHRECLLAECTEKLTQSPLYIKMLKLKKAVAEAKRLVAEEEEKRRIRRQRNLEEMEKQRRREEEERKREREYQQNHAREIQKLKLSGQQAKQEKESGRPCLLDSESTFTKVLNSLSNWADASPFIECENEVSNDECEGEIAKDDGYDFF